MGWCSGTDIFDAVVESIYNIVQEESSRFALIYALAKALEQHEWDCHSDSVYYEKRLVQSVFKELHPNWDIEETEELTQPSFPLATSFAVVDTGMPLYTLSATSNSEAKLDNILQLLTKILEKLNVS